MARTYGLASDKVRAIEVVTGDGMLRRATPTEHPDLFYGLRGGKGMLGIVTAIEFDLVHQPTFYGGSLWFDGNDAAAVIKRWLLWSKDLPELGTTSIALFQLPAMPGVPPALADRMTLSVRYVWTGDAEDGERRFAEIRGSAPTLLDSAMLSRWPPCHPSWSLTANGISPASLTVCAAASSPARSVGSSMPSSANRSLL